MRLVEEAQEAKAPTERFIDRFSRWYTPGVVVVAALVAVGPPLLVGGGWDDWIYKGLAILLIGCPCALVISTPAAIAAGLSAGARRGLLLKGGIVLESLGRITTVAFDKTGTLTQGRPVVTDVVALGRPERDVLSLAAALESGSSPSARQGRPRQGRGGGRRGAAGRGRQGARRQGRHGAGRRRRGLPRLGRGGAGARAARRRSTPHRRAERRGQDRVRARRRTATSPG